MFFFFLRIQESKNPRIQIQESKNPRIQESKSPESKNPRIQKPISLTRVKNPKLRIQNSRLPESRIQIQESKILAYQSPESKSKNPKFSLTGVQNPNPRIQNSRLRSPESKSTRIQFTRHKPDPGSGRHHRKR